MKQVSRSALLPWSAEQMFDLVNDVAAYQSFLPWCSGSEVLAATEQEMTARLSVSGAGIAGSFTTRNRLYRPERIEISLVDGPFSSLDGWWRFSRLGEAGCKVELSLSFGFGAGLPGAMLGKVFERAAGTLVDAFCRRAQGVYG